MKIKRERQVRLDELIKYVWDNDSKEKLFWDQHGNEVQIQNGVFYSGNKINDSSLFTITEEVEIDEDTRINLAYRIKTEKGWQTFDKNEVTINKIINTYKKHYHVYLGFIYLLNLDGSIGPLIWKDGEMID